MKIENYRDKKVRRDWMSDGRSHALCPSPLPTFNSPSYTFRLPANEEKKASSLLSPWNCRSSTIGVSM